MARLEIPMPDTFSFTTDIVVRITDINYGQHLGHDSVMSILHEARVRMLRKQGFSEMDVGGCGLIMADASIVFQSEVFYPSTLRVDVAVGDLRRSSFGLYYRVSHIESGAAVAQARTGMVCFDYTRKRPARMPDAFVAAYGPSGE